MCFRVAEQAATLAGGHLHQVGVTSFSGWRDHLVCPEAATLARRLLHQAGAFEPGCAFRRSYLEVGHTQTHKYTHTRWFSIEAAKLSGTHVQWHRFKAHLAPALGRFGVGWFKYSASAKSQLTLSESLRLQVTQPTPRLTPPVCTHVLHLVCTLGLHPVFTRTASRVLVHPVHSRSPPAVVGSNRFLGPLL